MKKSSAILTIFALLIGLSNGASHLFAQTRSAKKPVNTTIDNDIKIRVRNSMEGNSFDSTQYIKGSRERTEMNIGKGFINLVQCDLQRTIQINDDAKTYMIQSMNDGTNPDAPTADPNRKAPATTPQARRGGIITMTNTITDTGERKEMFGFTARHIKTSMVSESSPEACTQDKTRMETDGWYIDLNYGLDCQTQAAQAQSRAYNVNQCQDEYRYKNIGSGKLGFPLDSITTIYSANGSKTVMKREVIELSRASLDAALFEIPAGYTEAKDYQQFIGMPANPASLRDSANQNPPSQRPSSQAMPSANTTTAPLTPKKANVIRIGVVLPKAQMGQGFAGADVAEPVRHTVMQSLNGPAVEVIALEARAASQIILEAREKECDYVLQSSVTQKQGGGGLGGFLKKASPVANVIPMVGSAGSTAGAVASTVATTLIYTTADLAGNFKAKDEVTLEYQLTAVSNNAAVLTDTLKAKARSDREDLLSPIIEQMATAVLNAAIKR